MERVYCGICGMRQDMKNTISVIMQLAAGKEDGLQVYLEEEGMVFPESGEQPWREGCEESAE